MNSLNGYLPELMAFHHVARAGGFTQAAEELNLSKAQLSKQVSRLETIMGAQLFIRTTRRLSLTEEGKALLHYSQEIVDLSREASESIRELTSTEGGLIRLTAPNSLGDWFAPELLKIFQDKMPQLKVEIDLANDKRDLVEEGYDFAFRAMIETNPDLIARFVGHLSDVICATPAFIKEHKLKGQDPLEIRKVPILVHSHQKMWNTWKLQKGKKDLVMEVEGSYACSSYATTRLICLEGLGLARLPYYLVREDIAQGKLTHLYSSFTISTHPLYLVYPKRNYRSKKQTLVRDLMLNWFKEQQDVFN